MCLAHMCVQRQLRTSARTGSQKCSHKHPALNAHTCTHTRPHRSCVPTHPYTCVLTNSAHGPVHTLTPLPPGLHLRHAPSGSHPCSSSTRGLPLPASPPLTCSVHPQLQAPPTSGPTSAEASCWGPQVNPAAPGLCAEGHQSHAKLPTRAGRASDTELGQQPLPARGHCPCPQLCGSQGPAPPPALGLSPGPCSQEVGVGAMHTVEPQDLPTLRQQGAWPLGSPFLPSSAAQASSYEFEKAGGAPNSSKLEEGAGRNTNRCQTRPGNLLQC